MMNFKKYTLKQLREKYLKCVKVEERTSKFLNFQYALDREIEKLDDLLDSAFDRLEIAYGIDD